MVAEPCSDLCGQLDLIPEKRAAIAQIGEGVKHSLSTPGILIEFANYEA